MLNDLEMKYKEQKALFEHEKVRKLDQKHLI